MTAPALADSGQLTRAEAAARLTESAEVWVRLVTGHSCGEHRAFRVEITTAVPPPGFEELSWDYGKVWFRSTTLRGELVAAWLTSGVVEFRGQSFQLEIAEAGWYDRLPSRADYDRPPLAWPYTRVTYSHATGKSSRPDTGRFLVAPNAPSFPSYDMATEVFFHGVRLPSSAHDSALVTVRLADRSARLARFAFSLSGVEVLVEGERAAGCRVEFVAGDVRLAKVADEQGLATFELPGVPREWWSVASNGHQWLDYLHVSPYGRRNLQHVELPADELDPADEVDAILFGGESATAEFKRQLPAGGGEHRKIARTIAAFANGDGGVILFGVDRDEVTVVGIEESFVQARDLLTHIVTGVVTPRPPFDIRAYETDLGLVVGLHVGAGTHPLYGVDHTNPRYYIRRAASTFPARPDEVVALVQSRQPQVAAHRST